MEKQATNRILIAGGGPVGATLALALAQNGVPGAPLSRFSPNLVYARRANVARGASLAPNWTLDGARAPSRWWFAA